MPNDMAPMRHSILLSLLLVNPMSSSIRSASSRRLAAAAWAIGLAGATATAAAQAQPVSCMVLGPTTARVKAVEGERSPVFSTHDCTALRLLSGAARASWIGSDGKPHLVPITADGVARAPQPGSETRSVNVVWAELSSRREQAQPAYMRSVGFDRPLRVHVPADGLPLLGESRVPGVWLNLAHGPMGWALACGAAHRLTQALTLGDPSTIVQALRPARLGL